MKTNNECKGPRVNIDDCQTSDTDVEEYIQFTAWDNWSGCEGEEEFSRRCDVVFVLRITKLNADLTWRQAWNYVDMFKISSSHYMSKSNS